MCCFVFFLAVLLHDFRESKLVVRAVESKLVVQVVESKLVVQAVESKLVVQAVDCDCLWERKRERLIYNPVFNVIVIFCLTDFSLSFFLHRRS